MLNEEKRKRIEKLKAEYADLDMKQNSKKLTLNSTYGLLANKYNFMYSPEQQINVCLTGQLFLLMCGEIVAKNGGVVTSYNTDGLNFYCDKENYNSLNIDLFGLELDSGQVLEYTPYKSTYHRDVNNYLAIKPDGVKGKGFMATGGLMKNPTNIICVDAITAYLTNNTPIEQTIKGCEDVTKFISIRTVQGGAVWRNEYLGKAVRFYYSKGGDTITYKKNGNKVPRSDGAKPLMDLPESLPKDLNYQWYIDEAISMLGDLGVNYVRK